MKKVSVAVLLPGPKSSIKDFDLIFDLPPQVCEAEYQSAEKSKDEDHNHDSIFDLPSDDEGYKGDNDEVQWGSDDDLERRCDEFIAKQHKQWKEESINDNLHHNHVEEYGTAGMSEDLEYSEDNYITAEEEFEAIESSLYK